MPTETLIVVVVIGAAFAGFATFLAWADFYSSRSRRN